METMEFTCQQVRIRAAKANAPAMPCAADVCRKIFCMWCTGNNVAVELAILLVLFPCVSFPCTTLVELVI